MEARADGEDNRREGENRGNRQEEEMRGREKKGRPSGF